MNFEIGAVGSSGGYGTGFLECASDMVFALERREQSKKVRQVPVIRYGGGKRWEPAEKRGAICSVCNGGAGSPSF